MTLHRTGFQMSESAAAQSVPSQVPTEEAPQEEKKLNPKELRKLQRLAEEKERQRQKEEMAAKFADSFGKGELIQSKVHQSRNFVALKDAARFVGQTIVCRGRVHTSRSKGKMAFVVLRGDATTLQAVLEVGDATPKQMIDYAASIPTESIVDVEGVVSPAVTTCTINDFELRVTKIHLVSEAVGLPFTLEDASRPNTEEGVKILFDTRLNTRWLDMRTPATNALFKMQSRVGQYFRQFMIDNDFTEIHSPKIIGAASEGGANVFKLDYFGRPAFLAQSPQLYKQMAIQGDLPRVFEVAPVFRAENSNTHRHLTEFMGLDVEMVINEHYYEVLDVAESLFFYMFTQLATHTAELEAICHQYPFEPLVFQIPAERLAELGVGIIEGNKAPTDKYNARVRNETVRMLRIPYADCIALLNTIMPADEQLSPIDDINTANEKRLGGLIKERYGVDFFISDRFPSAARPFYTMACPDDERFTNSYDMFIRGEEISSGAQRIHDSDLLLARAKLLGVDLSTIKDYVECFRLGAWPHGGFGVGLERVVMLYLGLSNIRFASLFPRDPHRITP